MMKRRFVFLVFMVSLCVSMSYAQTESYRNLVREWIETGVGGNPFSVDAMKGVYLEVNKEVLDSADADVIKNMSAEQKQKLSESLADKYVKEQFMIDLADVFASMWKDKVTEEQLQGLVEMTRTPHAKAAIARMNKVTTNNLQQEVMQMMMPAISAIMSGEKPKPIEPVACSDTYKQVFHEYYEKAEAGNMLATLEKSVQSLSSQGDEKTKKYIVVLMGYMRDNMEVLMRNMMLGKVTYEDLNYLTELASTPAYKGVMLSLQNDILSNPMSFMTLLMEKYGEWMEANIDSLL